MPWLSFASHLNPSPNFVFFSLFVPYRITNPNKFLFIRRAFSHAPLLKSSRGYKEQWANQSDDSRTKNRVLLSWKAEWYKKESVPRPESEGAGKSDEVSVVTGEVSEIQMLLEKYFNVYEDRIGLEKYLPRQQNKCGERHEQAVINAPQDM